MIDFAFLSLVLEQISAVYARIFQFDLMRYLFGAGGVFVVVNLAAARWLQGRKIRNKSPEARQMLREGLTSLRTAAIFAANGVVVFLLREAGLVTVLAQADSWGWGYFALCLGALIVLHDAWFYWTHRLLHDPRLFRRVHRTHHKSHNPSPWTAYSFDISEAAINAIYLPIVLIFLPAPGLAIFLFLAHMMVRNAVGHCGYELFPATREGRPIFDWMTTVTHHDLHHAQAGWNFGLYFSWWDRLMGTEHPFYHEKFAAAVRKPLDGSAVAAIAPRGSAAICVSCVAALVVALATMHPASRAAAAPLTPEIDLFDGVWATQGHGAHVAFAPCVKDPSTICGRLVWSWDPEIAVDAAAPAMLSGLTWTGAAWEGGRLINPEDGRTYRGRMTPNPDGSLRLRGCALVFCQSQIWRRVQDVPGCKAAKPDDFG